MIYELIKREKFLSIFFRKNKNNNDYSSNILIMLNSLSTCEKTFNSLIELIKNYNYEYSTNLKYWNEYAQGFVSNYETDIYLARHQKDKAYHNFIDRFKIIHSKFVNNKNTNPDFIYNNLVSKAIHISKEENCNIYIKELLQAKSAYENLKQTENIHIEVFKGVKQVLDEHSIKLEKSLNSLKLIDIEKKTIWEA